MAVRWILKDYGSKTLIPSEHFPMVELKMDIIFKDNCGSNYRWTPKWEEVRNILAEAERVEEINVESGEWLDQLKEKKKFSDEVLTEIAKTLGDTRTGSQITDFFKVVGFPKIKHDGSTKGRFVRDELLDLNKQDYRNIVRVIQKMADPKQYIDKEEEHSRVVQRLNKALKHENLKVTTKGQVKPLCYEESNENGEDTT